MNRRQLQATSEQVRKRAVALGEAGEASAISELLDLCRHPQPAVRRAAASGLGKLSPCEGICGAVPRLCELVCDTHPQVCQYAIVALGRIGDEAALPALRDAVFIERRNFDMKVQNQKTILTADRTVVQSQGERRIADWLAAHHIAYRYDDKFQIIQAFAVRPDFYLPRHDVYIEYWGLDTTDYTIGMLLKQKLYQQEGKKLVSLYPDDLQRLDDKLGDLVHGS